MIKEKQNLYTIGTASKLTNISVNTIRTWERRYFETLSTRSETGRRFYDEYAVQKLRTIKTLSDSGMSVRDLANLSLEKLEDLIRNAAFSKNKPQTKTQLHIKEAITITGNYFSNRKNHYQNNYSVIQSYNKISELLISNNTDHDENIDRITHLIDFNEIRGEQLEEQIKRLAKDFPDQTIVMFYDFAPRKELQLLFDHDIEIIRTNIPHILMDRYLREIIQNNIIPSNQSIAANEDQIPQRMIQDKQLYYLQEAANNLECECPNHLSSLALSLGSFVEYSKNCVNKSEKDRLIHQSLALQTSKALEIIEEALLELCQHENIQLPTTEK